MFFSPAYLTFSCHSPLKIIFPENHISNAVFFIKVFSLKYISRFNFSQQVIFSFSVINFQIMSTHLYIFPVTVNVFSKSFPPNPYPENTKLTNHTDWQKLTFFPYISFHSCFYIVTRINFTGILIFDLSYLFSLHTYFSQPEYLFLINVPLLIIFQL